MISKRRGKVFISKEIFEEVQTKMNALNCILYYIDYKPFNNGYEVLFTSEYLPEIDDCTEVPEYLFEKSYGIKFIKI